MSRLHDASAKTQYGCQLVKPNNTKGYFNRGRPSPRISHEQFKVSKNSAPEVLEAAAWKALARPLTDDVPRWVGNGNHAGKPVTAMLQHQYLYMMHAVNERFNRSLLASYAPTYKSEKVSQEILNAVELQRQLHESLKMQEESIQLAYAHIEPEKFLALLFEQARHGADLAGQIAFSSAYVATRLWFDDIEQMQLEEALEIIQGFTGEYGATLAVFVNEHINNHFK